MSNASKSVITDYPKIMEHLERFQEYVHAKNKERGFDDGGYISFRDSNSILAVEEDYKSAIAVEARRILNYEAWDESWIGTGKIAACAQKAVDSAGNLVHYNQMISFENRLNPDHEDYNPEAERTLYEIYRGSDERAAMQKAIEVFGQKYDTIAYLFFIKDDTRFLPNRPTIIDESLGILGIDYKTSYSCSYDNYLGYIDIIEEIRDIMDANLPSKGKYRLIDAHSFVWIVHEKDYETWTPAKKRGNGQKKTETAKYLERKRREQKARDNNYPKHYVSDIALDKDDWKRLLTNRDIFFETDIDLLKRIYLSDNHASTCSELAIQDGTSPSAYISPAVQLAKRVSKSENLDPIFGEDGVIVWWRVLFWGSFRDDNHFEWKLRPELADALSELFPDLDLLEIDEEAENKLVEETKRASLAEASDGFEYSHTPREKQKPTYSGGHPVYPRSRKTALNALAHAKYSCEIDANHPSFLRKNSDKHYTEPHHLIPMSYSDDFDVSLDVEENIVSLCSNCHNWLHYGENPEALLLKLYNERIEHLKEVEIDISFERLLEMYGIS